MLDISAFPPPLQSWLEGAIWRQENLGWSRAEVYHLSYPDHGSYYLKRVSRGQPWELRELEQESDILAWLRRQLPVPEVLYAGINTVARYQLTTEIPGLIACDPGFHDDRTAIVQALATGLQWVHSIPIAQCPFDQQLETKLELARYRIEHGLVDPATFEESRQARSPLSILAELEQTAPTERDLVFTHGDYCLPNVMVDPVTLTLTGLIDWGRAGVADRYQDLGIATRSVGYNLGDEWVEPFLEAYGEPEPDRHRIEYFVLLDELF